MLKTFSVSNFYSIGMKQEISLDITSKDVLNDSAIEVGKGKYLNTVVAIIGPNGSGKTTILKAMSFLFWLINDSYTMLKDQALLPFIPHKFMESQNSIIEIEFINQKDTFKYHIEFNTSLILKEVLYKNNERTSIFQLVRSKENVEINTSPNLKINESDKTRFESRKNVPILSSLIDTGYLPEVTFFKKFTTNVNQTGTVGHSIYFQSFISISRDLQSNEQMRSNLLNFSKDLDMGLSEFQIGTMLIQNGATPPQQEKAPILECVHKSKNKQFTLPLFAESNGTQNSVFLYLKISTILQQGGLVEIDEIDNGIHLEAVKKIISLFENKETNPYHAQLIFSTHQLPLLNDRTKTQIYITEKNENLETELFQLSDVNGVRNDENFFHKYSAGAYGGIPSINWLDK